MRSFGPMAVGLACLLALPSLVTPRLWAADQHPLRAAAVKVDITPSDLTDLNAWGGSFTDVHDPIFARVLVLENAVNTAALVALDLVETGDTIPVRERIERELGIPADHILITSSHDHSAPRAGVVTPGGLAHGPSRATAGYTKTVYDKIVGALKEAKASLQPARFGFGTGFCDINVNRDEYIPETQRWRQGVNQGGPSEKTVWVLKVESSSGEPIALVFNYAVHSAVVLGTGSLSGDLAGAAERYVEARYDNKVVALYTMGPAGDQNPRIMLGGPGGGGSKADPAVLYDAANAMGTMLGAEVVRTARLVREETSSVRIEAGARVVSCPVKQGVNQMGDMRQETVSSMPLHLALILINQVALTGVSGEVTTNIYLHLKKASPLTNTIMVTLANDRVGYIVDDAAYDTPYFETNGTPLARGCAEDGIVDGLVGLINESYPGIRIR
jgi:neutral ceramidase